jgi:hypothetical protein
VPRAFQWEDGSVPHHIAVVETAQRRYDFLPQALQRIYGVGGRLPTCTAVTLSPLAVGGAMAVYTITLAGDHQSPYALVGKIPHQRRLTYAAGTDVQAVADTTSLLLRRLVALADHLAQRAPGLFPRSGGVWHWQEADGKNQHLLVEEFIPGLSIERLQLRYEQQFLAGVLSAAAYQQRRSAATRMAVATFIRLWDVLGRHTFTSDPSPWNILVRQPEQEPLTTQGATIIDLHGLEEGVGLTYVVQRLAAVYGLRQEVIEHALIPGILDALGEEAGRALLLAELPQLVAEAEQIRRNLGVDMQQPLLHGIRQLA